MLNDLNFADSESLLHAQLALNPPRPSCFVVSGPAGCGKTRFVDHCLKRLLGNAAFLGVTPQPATERGMARMLFDAADCGWAHIDNWRGPLDSTELRRFLQAGVTGHFYHGRRHRQPVQVRNAAVLFITGANLEACEPGVRAIRLLSWPSERKSG